MSANGTEHPHVVAVVLNWNGRDDTLACLESLSVADWPRLTIIAVDNASAELLEPAVAARFPEVLVVRNTANLGFAGGMNVGMRRALALGADYVLLLNNDTLVDTALVRILVDAAERHADVGMVCPLILYRDRPEVILSAGLSCDLRRAYQGPPHGRGQRDRGQFGSVREVDAPTGAAMLVPVDVVREVGMLDEALFLYGEDVEWATRMRARGLRVYVAPCARLWHGVSSSSGGQHSPLSAYYLTRNSFVVSARHAPLSGPRALVRTADILVTNLYHARRAHNPAVNARAVLRGWHDYLRGRLGPIDVVPARPRDAALVAISAGFDKTHMTTAAREASDRHRLAVAITGAYPTERVRRGARLAELTGLAGPAGRGRIVRLADRDECLAQERLRSFALPEALYGAAWALAGLPRSRPLAQRLSAATWSLYGWRAGRALSHLTPTPGVYHFRAGYGQASVARARSLGMHVLCDHALAHPAVLDALVRSRGRSPGTPRPGGQRVRLDPLAEAALRDIDCSDSILVNSQFVKDTFLACGWSPERVHVIYLGLDDNFLRAVPDVRRSAVDGPLQLLFAGRLEARKGTDVLAEALAELDDVPWELVLAGPVAPDGLHMARGLLADPRVCALGPLRRPELAQAMAAAPVFVFPSYAEGSARVVFEALACGCYVITTPNSGTIVEDGVHGALVPPGDARALADAIRAASADRERVAAIGNRNAALIRERFRQRDYGDALAALYARLTGAVAPPYGVPRPLVGAR